MARNRTAAVLIHELGHALVAEVEDTTLPAAREELLVESVVFWPGRRGLRLGAWL